jgi:hypothetical protein
VAATAATAASATRRTIIVATTGSAPRVQTGKKRGVLPNDAGRSARRRRGSFERELEAVIEGDVRSGKSCEAVRRRLEPSKVVRFDPRVQLLDDWNCEQAIFHPFASKYDVDVTG